MERETLYEYCQKKHKEWLLAEWDAEKNAPLTPETVGHSTDYDAWWKCERGHSYKTKIKSRIVSGKCPYCAGLRVIPEENSLAVRYPKLIEEWDSERNAGLTPWNVFPGTHKKAWWKCGVGHSWCAEIKSRALNGRGCPYCAGRAIQVGDNDLATCFPELAEEWDYEKNGSLTPQDIVSGTRRKVWWCCAKGHSWCAQVNSRAQGVGCPYCVGKAVQAGYNDLATCFPKLAGEWDYEKNGSLTPQDVLMGSTRKVWWRCAKGHSFLAQVKSRTRQNSGCPYCGNRRVLPGSNDLATTYPQLAAQWDAEHNGELLPTQVTAGSHRRVWWRCKAGHTWQARINSRVSDAHGCPYCSNCKVLPGFNDLATTNPDIAAEWDTEKNAPLTPQNVVVRNERKVWWICGEGHSYQAFIHERTTRGSGCPYCAMRRIGEGINDLAARFPHLAAQWDREKNGQKTPEGMPCASVYRAWWRCPQGHSYQAEVRCRVYEGNNCPYCSGRRVWPGFNDLASQRPEIAAQWHPTLNGLLTPEQVTLGSGKAVWWQCLDGHVWRTQVFNRTAGSGCPVCSGRISKKRQAYYKLLESPFSADGV